jgi:hypothetical protein
MLGGPWSKATGAMLWNTFEMLATKSKQLIETIWMLIGSRMDRKQDGMTTKETTSNPTRLGQSVARPRLTWLILVAFVLSLVTPLFFPWLLEQVMTYGECPTWLVDLSIPVMMYGRWILTTLGTIVLMSATYLCGSGHRVRSKWLLLPWIGLQVILLIAMVIKVRSFLPS